jgi:uncharacterized Zn finger protein
MNNDFQSGAPIGIVEERLKEFFSIVDVNRLKRGKILYNQGSIVDFKRKENGFFAKIQGSRKLPYETKAVFSCDETGLPVIDSLYIDCTCPDWVEFCKHGICAMVYFSNELNRELSVSGNHRRNKNDRMKADRIKKLTALSDHKITRLGTASFWQHEPQLNLAMKHVHKKVRNGLQEPYRIR